jgi:transcriptional regulator with XRE-family HTH domain
MAAMAQTFPLDARPSPLGALLQYWRRARNLSQLALAHEANVSPRHVSFVETGRSRPSRDMVLLLADALGVPLRERNALLLSAGFAPVFRESALDDRELTPVRTAIGAILKQQEPYPAVVMNRRWDIVAANGAATRFFGLLLDGRTPYGAGNVLRLMFHPDGLRPCVENWEAVAHSLVRRVHREALAATPDDAGRALLAEVLGYPGVPARWRTPDLGAPIVPVVPVSFRHGKQRFDFFSAVTVLGTPQDVTVQELRVECFFPLDDATAAAAGRLLG